MNGNKRKTSMQDIADYLNVSKNAVSLALNNKSGVSEELRQRILKAAYDLNYSSLQTMEKKKNNNIIVLIPDYIRNDPFFYYDIYWSIEKAATNRGFKVIITSITKEIEKKLIMPELYNEMEFSGILVVGVLSREYIKTVQATGLPMIIVDHYYDDMQIDAVVTANEEGAFTIVNHLIENGHKDIGYIGSIEMTASLYERWSGFKKAMLQSGLEVNKKHCILNSSPLEDLLADPEEIGQYLDSMESYPTAWFCGGDRIAIALINALAKRNIRVPEDVSVVGFDDIEASKLIVPSLTTIHVKREEMAGEAVDFLIRRMKEDGAKLKVTLYGDLVVRESVKKISE